MALQSMGRQRGNPMAVGGGNGGNGGVSSSSIALLQERFRQLEKMRERREGMELLKLFSDSETISQTKHNERSGNMLLHPEMISHQPTTTTTTTTTTKRTCIQDSLSLGLDIYGKKTEQQQSKAPPYRDFWSMDSVRVSTSRARDKHDVDTSLHL